VWSHPAVRERQTPLLVADMRALERNARNLADRAGAKPIRIATKSIRVREILHRVLELAPLSRAPHLLAWLNPSG